MLLSTRVLFLDDSGKPDLSHPSLGLVIGEFSVPSTQVPTLSRRVAGAKARFYPARGDPASWELKSSYIVKPNPWKRRKNRDFVDETIRIVEQAPDASPDDPQHNDAATAPSEERRAEKELAAERERLNKERAHYMNALEALRANNDEEPISEMEQRLGDIDKAIKHNDYRTANIRAGYVYVISNPGSFGKRMIKIGMTRRLVPMDRVRELGDASVPFPFDVHALFFADDAVTVENELHKVFAEARVNHVNKRREFFFATPNEVREVLAKKIGSLLEFAEHPESTQYLQSRRYWPSNLTTPTQR